MTLSGRIQMLKWILVIILSLPGRLARRPTVLRQAFDISLSQDTIFNHNSVSVMYGAWLDHFLAFFFFFLYWVQCFMMGNSIVQAHIRERK